MTYVRAIASFVLVWVVLSPERAPAQSTEASIVDAATEVLQQTMMLPAEHIPRKLLDDARGLAIFPNVIKGGFVLGVRHGRGVMLVRDNAGKWQSPAFLSITGGSIGWQAGLQATDLILIFRTHKSIDNLLHNKVTLGIDAAVAAGPVGRMAAASTDLMLRAEILSYSRSRGLFAGVSLDGSSLQIDPPAGMSYYGGMGTTPLGRPASPTSTVPPSAERLIAQLAVYTDGDPGNDAPVPIPSVTVPVPVAETTTPDALRQQLMDAAIRLDSLLDEQWKPYLFLPPEITGPATPATMPAITKALRRYDTVAVDPRYAALAQRPEFIVAHRFLRDYASTIASRNAPAIALPPPPGDPSQSP